MASSPRGERQPARPHERARSDPKLRDQRIRVADMGGFTVVTDPQKTGSAHAHLLGKMGIRKLAYSSFSGQPTDQCRYGLGEGLWREWCGVDGRAAGRVMARPVRIGLVFEPSADMLRFAVEQATL